MTEHRAFINKIKETKQISIEAISAITANLRVNRYAANETILSPGNYPSAIYFIQKGIIIGAFEGRNSRLVSWFKNEDELVICPSLFSQQPGDEYIIAVNSVSVLLLPYVRLLNIITDHPEVAELLTLLVCETAAAGKKREFMLRINTAKGRYDYLRLHASYVLQHVPHYLIASYINVTPETFSRIHKGLAY